MESKEEAKRKKQKEVLKLSIVLFFGSLIIIFILKDAPAPWKDPLGFIWYIITQPEPTGWTPMEWPLITWLMIFSIFYIIWIFSVYDYVIRGIYSVNKLSELSGKVLFAWLIATLVLFFASIIIRDIAYYGFTDTVVVWGIILAIILIGILKERLS